ncbi:MAG: lipocalin-like domain-containing protein [Bacteroidales bacterium]|nr:lipocalin-like domain-containing protein [Bacteroidales bacterium]
MVRFYKSLILFCIFLLSACQEGGEAGDLFGQWRLKGADNKYISFAGSITVIRSIGEGEVYGNFQHIGDSLFIQCYSIKGERIDTVIVKNTFGFDSFNNIRVRIDKLDDDDLVISNTNKTWSFYQY